MVNHLRQYSRAWAGSWDMSTARSLFFGPKGSNVGANPAFSRSSLILPRPTFLALPHSEACKDTSIPVGRSPRKAAMMSHDPWGASKMKK